MKPIIKYHSEYMGYPVGVSLQQAREYVQAAWRILLKHKKFTSCDCINLFVRGSSGLILGTFLAEYVMHNSTQMVHLYYVRKESEYNHHGDSGYCRQDSEINIVIDDFISGGGTILAIWHYMFSRFAILCIDVLIVGGGEKMDRPCMREVPYRMLITQKQAAVVTDTVD